ncbi:hypothetical protein BJX68DRAFT_236295 [Aspergillus pseudodeflectus]|uniref:Uncharacterized protein n=1 Tax=Aspergillus pseudodeflectus TaxID=176178 RepID=A0ABR4KET2_9EURO
MTLYINLRSTFAARALEIAFTVVTVPQQERDILSAVLCNERMLNYTKTKRADEDYKCALLCAVWLEVFLISLFSFNPAALYCFIETRTALHHTTSQTI